MALQRGRPTENRWIGQRIAGPDIDIAAIARAQGAIGLGPVKTLAQMQKVLREAVAKTLAGNVLMVDIRVVAEYDAALANLMVRGEK